MIKHFAVSFLKLVFIKNVKIDSNSNLEIDCASNQYEPRARIPLKGRLVRKNIPKKVESTLTGDDLCEKMNARSRAIMNGDFSSFESNWKLNFY